MRSIHASQVSSGVRHSIQYTPHTRYGPSRNWKATCGVQASSGFSRTENKRQPPFGSPCSSISRSLSVTMAESHARTRARRVTLISRDRA